MRRMLGATVIVVGAVVIGFNPDGFDPVVLHSPWKGHGIHLTDVVGMTFVLAGIAVLWRAPGNEAG